MLQKKGFYYLFIFVPLFTMIVFTKITLINANIFMIGLLLYVFVYHPYISGKRLVALKSIQKSEFWRTFIPFWNLKFFDVLFFG